MYEDSLDKLKRSYKIDYGLGPTYDDVKITRYLFRIIEKIKIKHGSILWYLTS